MHYQELETEKYMQQHVDDQYKGWRRARSRKAVRDFLTFLFGLVVIGLAFELIARMPKWMPLVNDFLRQ